jgi:hypothetical protein
MIRLVDVSKLFVIALLSGCTSLLGDNRSVPEVIAASEARADPEAGFWRYGPFTFQGKYRIEHEWVKAYPRATGLVGCSYAWEGETKDRYGRRAPIKAGLDLREENTVLYQNDFDPRTGLPNNRDMTIYVIGKYRPNAPGGPRYDHEALCSTAYDGIGNLFNLYLKKTSLAAMREVHETQTKQMRHAKLLAPLKYESIMFAGLPAEKVTEVVALGLKGMEDKPVREVTEDIRIPIGDTGYVYQLAFTL